MNGVAARYPRVDPDAARLVNLAGRINVCHDRNWGRQQYLAVRGSGLPVETPGVRR